jgi:hypothetical protein
VTHGRIVDPFVVRIESPFHLVQSGDCFSAGGDKYVIVRGWPRVLIIVCLEPSRFAWY